MISKSASRLIDAMRFGELSDKQQRIGRLIAQGLTDKEIARELSLNLSTIHYHVNEIIAKFLANNRTHVAVLIDREIRDAV